MVSFCLVVGFGRGQAAAQVEYFAEFGIGFGLQFQGKQHLVAGCTHPWSLGSSWW